MSHGDKAENGAPFGKNYSRGNRVFITLGFLLVGAIEGVSRMQSSGDRETVAAGLERLWIETNALKVEVAEIKTMIRDNQKRGETFEVDFSKLQDRVQRIEIDQARDEGGTKNRPAG